MEKSANQLNRAAAAVPPHAWFGVSAIFHYLGPSFAVLLFPAIGVLGVAWLRIGTAALILAPWTRPWRTWRLSDSRTKWLLILLGLCLAGMNTAFYLALDRLSMALVAAIEFAGTIVVAAYGFRTIRNFLALALSIAGVWLLVGAGLGGGDWLKEPLGLLWAVLNGALFVGYIILGHRLAASGATEGVARLGAAMTIGFIFIMPVGLIEVLAVVDSPFLLLAGAGVGLCSSVIPYICDQLAMSRLPRASFALLLALLPATATAIAAAVLAQIPSLRDLVGVGLVMLGVAIHRPVPAFVAD